MEFRRILANGNPVPPIRHGYNNTSLSASFTGPTGLFSLACYSLLTPFSFFSAALNRGEPEKVVYDLGLGLASLTAGYGSAALANYVMRRSQTQVQGNE